MLPPALPFLGPLTPIATHAQGLTVVQNKGHNDHVNAVEYADDTGNLIYTGGDDKYVKVGTRAGGGMETEGGWLPGDGWAGLRSAPTRRSPHSPTAGHALPPPLYILQVWDRRMLRARARTKPVGVFIGHTDGVTHIDSKVGGQWNREASAG